MIQWKKIHGLRAWSATLIGTGFGAGLSPIAPGTAGTIVALPLAYFTQNWDTAPRLLLWIGITLAGTWASRVLDEVMGSSDNQSIVVDEVVGLGIAAWTAVSVPAWICAFVLFRVFDVLKPWPVRLVDRWSKKKASQKTSVASSWWGGFGVMADDILAGLLALLVMIVLQQSGILP